MVLIIQRAHEHSVTQSLTQSDTQSSLSDIKTQLKHSDCKLATKYEWTFIMRETKL